MNSNELMEKLGKPFPADKIEWRLQKTIKDKQCGLAVPYVDARLISDRLNEVVGIWGWQNSYNKWHSLKNGSLESQTCSISIYCEERKDWVSKSDGAENTDIEPVKGGLSDAFKRAAVKWNIGRYLYEMDGVWVNVDPKGNSFVIRKGEDLKLKNAYNQAVSKIFSITPEKPVQKPADKPVKPQVELFSVKSVKESNGASGTNTQLEIVNGNGKSVKAYLKGSHANLGDGVRLKNIKLEEKDGDYGKYFVLNSYEIAA